MAVFSSSSSPRALPLARTLRQMQSTGGSIKVQGMANRHQHFKVTKWDVTRTRAVARAITYFYGSPAKLEPGIFVLIICDSSCLVSRTTSTSIGAEPANADEPPSSSSPSTTRRSSSQVSGPQLSSSTMPQEQRTTPTTSTPHNLTTDQLTTHLESLVHALITSVNTRALSSTNPLTASLSPTLSLNTDCLPPTTSLSDSLFTLTNHLQNNPHHHMHLSSVKGNVVNLRAGYADVYCRVVVTGVPQRGFMGVTVLVFEFREEVSRWMCVKVTGIRGLSINGAGTPT